MDVAGTIASVLAHKRTRDVFTIKPDATVLEAVRLMAEQNCGALLVVENDRLVGLVSERDYTRKIVLHGKRSRETPVREIMSTHLTTVQPNESVESCLRTMTEKHIRHLPVVTDGEICGVISIGDLVKHVISCQSAALEHLESYITGGYR